MHARSADPPPRLALDAGPIIALLHARDSAHAAAVAGFAELHAARSWLVTPLPVVFEVYKWLCYEARPDVARLGLAHMRRTLEIVYPASADMEDVSGILAAMPAWAGTLEDALVASVGLRLGIPVWTLSYRDLAAFRNLAFWTPASSG